MSKCLIGDCDVIGRSFILLQSCINHEGGKYPVLQWLVK